jgi:hypothetical protein
MLNNLNIDQSMKKNVGTIDKVVRILLAVVVIVLYFTNAISGTMAFILLALAAILIVTSFVSFCPIYYFLGLRTRKKE